MNIQNIHDNTLILNLLNSFQINQINNDIEILLDFNNEDFANLILPILIAGNALHMVQYIVCF